MSVDDLINSAFENRGGCINGERLFAVVADTQTKETFILDLQEFFAQNFDYFKKGQNSSMVFVAAYHSEIAARNAVASVREEGYNGEGVIAGQGWCVLMANVLKNQLYVLPLEDYYVGALAFYKYNVDAGIMALSICNRKEAAEDMIDYIRATVKDENGNIMS